MPGGVLKTSRTGWQAMPTVYEIPTSNEAQTFTISLAGVTWTVTLAWCDPAACWILNLGDATGNPVINGIPLVTGCDLLEQYGYAGVGGALVVQTDNDPDQVPAYAALGDTGHLYFVTLP